MPPSSDAKVTGKSPAESKLTGGAGSAKPEWFRWLGQIRDALGDKLMAGIALYAVPFGDRLLAAPISALCEL